VIKMTIPKKHDKNVFI